MMCDSISCTSMLCMEELFLGPACIRCSGRRAEKHDIKYVFALTGGVTERYDALF